MKSEQKFINEWYPVNERDASLIAYYQILRQLVNNDFAPGSKAAEILEKVYKNDIRSVLIKYDFLETENQVLIKCINEFCDARN